MTSLWCWRGRDSSHSCSDWFDSSSDFRKISIRLVVHTAMPVPKKSASSLQIPHSNARELAKTGQSSSSLPRKRLRASLSNMVYSSRSIGSIIVRKYASDLGTVHLVFPAFLKDCGKVFLSVLKCKIGSKETNALGCVTIQKLSNLTPQNGADQDVRIDNNHLSVSRPFRGGAPV